MAQSSSQDPWYSRCWHLCSTGVTAAKQSVGSCWNWFWGSTETKLRPMRASADLVVKIGFESMVLLNAILLVHPNLMAQNAINLGIDISGAVVVFHALAKKSHHDYLFKLLKVCSIGVIGGYAVHSFYMLLGEPLEKYNVWMSAAGASPPIAMLVIDLIRTRWQGCQKENPNPSRQELVNRRNKVKEVLGDFRADRKTDAEALLLVAKALNYDVAPKMQLTPRVGEEEEPGHVWLMELVSDAMLFTANIFFNNVPSVPNHYLMSCTMLLRHVDNLLEHLGDREELVGWQVQYRRFYALAGMGVVVWQFGSSEDYSREEQDLPGSWQAVNLMVSTVVVLGSMPLAPEYIRRGAACVGLFRSDAPVGVAPGTDQAPKRMALLTEADRMRDTVADSLSSNTARDILQGLDTTFNSSSS